MKTAWIAGASGLVGSKLLARLLDDAAYAAVVSLGRKVLPISNPKLTQRVIDFARLDASGLPSPELAFCALGTTIGKAGSQAGFRAVDHDAVLAFASAARAAGARGALLVSALGANASSSVFYNRVKGETEAEARKLGFESLIIAQPSLLLGDRDEPRPAERAAIVASRWLGPLLKPFAWRPIEADAVARALVHAARQPPPGVHIYPSGQLQTLGA